MWNFNDLVTTICRGYNTKCTHLLDRSVFVEEFLDFKLSDIFWDISLNERRYEWNYSAQLFLVQKYNIPSFEILYKIVSVLGFKNNLKWDKITMPISQFQVLNDHIENHVHKHDISQEEYIHIAQQISYFDLEKLYIGLKVLWFADNIQKISFSYDSSLSLLLYVTAVYDRNNLSRSDVESIHMHYYHKINSKNNKKNIVELSEMLIAFWYEIES